MLQTLLNITNYTLFQQQQPSVRVQNRCIKGITVGSPVKNNKTNLAKPQKTTRFKHGFFKKLV